MAGFVRRRKKWPQCVSNRCKDSFWRKKYFWVRGTLKTYLKNSVSKQAGLQFDHWFFRPEKFSGLSRNRPLDLKSGNNEFKPRSDHKRSHWFNSSAALVHSHQLVFLLSFAILNLFSSFIVLPSTCLEGPHQPIAAIYQPTYQIKYY